MNTSHLSVRCIATLFAVVTVVATSTQENCQAQGAPVRAVIMRKSVTIAPGADPGVSAELGGAGFEAIAASGGWDDGGQFTQEQLALIGDRNAIKGGEIRGPIGDFPATFRIFGKDASTATGQRIYSLVYEALIDVNPLTLGFIPALASHWKIDRADSQTYWFRIDPDARFSDGHRVTTGDVIATWAPEFESSGDCEVAGDIEHL